MLLSIDESQYLSVGFFRFLNCFLQIVRTSKNLFGGCQIIISYDPLQPGHRINATYQADHVTFIFYAIYSFYSM